MLTNTHSTTWYLLLYHNAHQHTALLHENLLDVAQCTALDTHSAIHAGSLWLTGYLLFIVSALSAANDVLYTQTHNISCTHNYAAVKTQACIRNPAAQSNCPDHFQHASLWRRKTMSMYDHWQLHGHSVSKRACYPLSLQTILVSI